MLAGRRSQSYGATPRSSNTRRRRCGRTARVHPGSSAAGRIVPQVRPAVLLGVKTSECKRARPSRHLYYSYYPLGSSPRFHPIHGAT
eukprot:scaffold124446_cov61-Phaeocystis_antarctica.AAC.6